MSKETTKVRVANAFRAMKDLGITEDKVKPVLKSLLKLYEKNWELIEDDNYRALADAIFEREEAEELSKKLVNNEAAEHSKKTMHKDVAEHSKKTKHKDKDEELNREAQATEEPERPLKRLRRKYQDAPSSTNACNGANPKLLLVTPKEEPNELPETSPPRLDASQGLVESPPPRSENAGVNSEAATSQLLGKNKGKQPMSPKSLTAHEGSDPCQTNAIGRNQQNTQLIIEPRSPSHSMKLRDRGKGSVSPQTPSREKRSVSETSSLAIVLKEPKVEPGLVLSPKHKSVATNALIKPKDEPVTDGMPCLPVPIAVVYPDPSSGGDSSRNGTIREHDSLEHSGSPSLNEKETAEDTENPNRPTNNTELAMICGPQSFNLEIASSPLREVKISLSCDLALVKPDFHVPSLETFLKSVEEKCFGSYKTFDPNFSMMNLMKEMCQCFLHLGSNSSSDSQETVNVAQSIDSLNELSVPDARGSLNGAVDSDDVEETLPEIPLPPPACNGIDDSSHLKKMDNGDDCITNIEDKDNTEEMNNLSLVVAQQSHITPEIIRFCDDAVDISKGQEKAVITLVNEVNNEQPPSFYYILQNTIFRNAHVNISMSRIGNKNCCSTCSGDCLSSSMPCACALETGSEFAYTTDGLVKEALLKECISMNRDPKKCSQFFCKECPLERSRSVNEDITEPCKGHLVRKFIKECWSKCGCNKKCGNRVVQRGITFNLQVYMTPQGKGWGLRTLEDLPKGAFVCEYVGEVLTNGELLDRVLRSPKGEKNSYPVLLDADWRAGGVVKDEEALWLDATYFGNVARFINHKCYDSNLVEIPVEVETPDHHYYHLAFFTTRKVKAMEELTWDYGIDFDDHDGPIKVFNCLCGSKFCRNLKRSRSTAARR